MTETTVKHIDGLANISLIADSQKPLGTMIRLIDQKTGYLLVGRLMFMGTSPFAHFTRNIITQVTHLVAEIMVLVANEERGNLKRRDLLACDPPEMVSMIVRNPAESLEGLGASTITQVQAVFQKYKPIIDLIEMRPVRECWRICSYEIENAEALIEFFNFQAEIDRATGFEVPTV